MMPVSNRKWRRYRDVSSAAAPASMTYPLIFLGEGAYFAPELGNVMKRWGVQDDPAAATEALKGWMNSMPSCFRKTKWLS